jgi:YVTN family beta-propeller protein
VANLLHTGRADVNYVAAVVSVIDTAVKKVVKELPLPNGSGSLNDIKVSPDGQYAVVTHLVARFSRLTTHVTEGWMNANALTIIDLPEMKIHGTMLLDDHFRGAANPWGVAWSADGKTLVVTHAGTHEVSVIDFEKLLAQLPALPANYDPVQAADSYTKTKANYEAPDELPYFAGSRLRIKLPAGDLGPRAVVIVGHKAYVANYFSDTLSVIDLEAAKPIAESIPLGAEPRPGIKLEMDTVRKGEFYFHDASLCYEGWQSCASCHPGDARADGLNWDLLNDGVDNPKNTKSLLLATRTPPLMSLGVRPDAKAAVRAGFDHILFTSQPEEVVNSIVAYLQSLKPVPSPHLVHGKLSEAAKRGEKLFVKTGCADCHVPGLYTDLHLHDVGTKNQHDGDTDKFYTPTLIEVWRTAPYLHDGSAATMRDVVTTCNADGRHGDVSGLSSQEIDDLCEYVLSL